MRTRSALVAVMLFLLAMPRHADAGSGGFAVYRATMIDKQFYAKGNGESAALWRIQNVDQAYLKSTAVSVGEPLLTDQDVIQYCWLGHRMRLTEDAQKRWRTALLDTPLAGSPIVIVVDSTVCYAGMVWAVPSSLSPPKVPFMDNMAMGGELRIQLAGRPTGEHQADERYDERIKRFFQQARKLAPTCETGWLK